MSANMQLMFRQSAGRASILTTQPFNNRHRTGLVLGLRTDFAGRNHFLIPRYHVKDLVGEVTKVGKVVDKQSRIFVRRLRPKDALQFFEVRRSIEAVS